MAAGVPPMLLEGGTGPYIETLKAVQSTLEIQTIVPRHGPMGDGKAALENFLVYLQYLQDTNSSAFAAGKGLDETLAASPLGAMLHLPEGISENAQFSALLEQLHRLDVVATYRALEGAKQT